MLCREGTVMDKSILKRKAESIMFTEGSTYIKHNWALQPFRWNYDIASHTTNAVCVNFIYERRVLQLKVDYERQVF